jgi:AraC family transcriptional regulator
LIAIAFLLRHITRKIGRNGINRRDRKMAEHVAEDFDLARLAAQAGLSKFHFQRLFKSDVGVPPSRYHINPRMNVERRLLRQTKKSVVNVALDVGYVNPSRFAKLFRGETGLSASDYRRRR